MSNLRIGVLGLGLRGNLAHEVHRPKNGGSEVVAVCDIREDRMQRFSKKIAPLLCFTDYQKLFACEETDALLILTPDFLHEEHGIAALESGKPVFLEKPLSISVESCDRILAAAKRTGTRLYLGHNMRHFPVILKLKEIVDSGRIGKVQAIWCRHFVSYGGDAYFKDWHSERENVNSLLLQKGAHDIDVLHWLSGSYTKFVVGMGKLSVYDKCSRNAAPNKELDWKKSNWPPEASKNYSKTINVEDHSMIMMQMENGVQCSYMQCQYTPDSGRNYTVIGTKGRIENIGDEGNCVIQVYTTRTDTFGKPDEVIDVEKEFGGHGGSDSRILDEFVRFAKEGGITNTNPVAARQAVAVGCMATESLRSDGGRREIPMLNQDLIDYFENGQI